MSESKKVFSRDDRDNPEDNDYGSQDTTDPCYNSEEFHRKILLMISLYQHSKHQAIPNQSKGITYSTQSQVFSGLCHKFRAVRYVPQFINDKLQCFWT